MRECRTDIRDCDVSIANAGTDMKEIYLKHSMDGVDSWTMLQSPSITYSDSVVIQLTGLQVGTTYQVAVALTGDFSGMLTCSFTTLAAPSVSAVTISDITLTSAVATVNIADAGTVEKTVYLRHRKFGENEWDTAQAKSVTGGSATYSLTGLTPRTTYEVQASLGSDFAASMSAVFTTSTPDPSLSRVSVNDITQTSARATAHIANPGTASKTVYLRHRASGTQQWSATLTDSTTGSSVGFNIAGLAPQTAYEVQAALSSDFSGSKTATFTTLAPDPSVSSIDIGSIAQTSAVATVAIADPGSAQKTVHLRYRVEGTSAWSSPALTATTYGASAIIDISGLTAGTEYEVWASLDSAFGEVVSATFTTLPYPSLSEIDVTDITKTTATAEIDIADPDGTAQTVRLRHRTTTPQGDWSGTQTTSKHDGSGVNRAHRTERRHGVPGAGVAGHRTSRSRSRTPSPPCRPIPSCQTSAWAASGRRRRPQPSTSPTRTAQTRPCDCDTARPLHRGEWSGTLTTSSSTDSAGIGLSGLTPGTEYEVQASLESTFPTARTRYDTFTTLRYPSIASFEAENISRNGATVSATIADSHGESQTVYIRHRQSRYVAWRFTQQTDSVDDIASLRLRGLSSDTQYIAEASLDSNFPNGATRSVTFTTKERRDDDDAPVAVAQAKTVSVPLLGFSPLMLRFVAIEGGDNPQSQTFSVWNRAQGAMDFILSNRQEWLSQEPTTGMSGGPADKVDITVSVDSSDLASGQYVDIISIEVSASGSSPGQVIVVLDVLPPDYIRQFVSRSEGGVVMLPDGTVKMEVQPLAPPEDVDIELMKVNLQAHGVPAGEDERVVVAIESSTYPPGGDTPEDVAYSPALELWMMLPDGEETACDAGRVRLYSVQGRLEPA